MKVQSPNRKTQVGLVQINNSFSDRSYLPLSVGMLQAYAQKYLQRPEDFEFMIPLYRRGDVTESVEYLIGADIVFFSTYVWNFRISSEIAERLKARSPETTIVFGGPHVPDRDDEFLHKYPFVDVACHGEGEATALAVLENRATKDWKNVPGISFLMDDGKLVRRPKSPRLDDLSTVPSPYLSGVFDPLMAANPSENWLAMWETNRGCPFSCAFCDWGSATQSKVHPFDLDRIYQEVDWFGSHGINFIWCCDANFGILPRDIDIAKYIAETKKKYGFPQIFQVQNTKNATERAYEMQTILAKAGLARGVDIALQSSDELTLANIKRANISSEGFQELQRRFRRDGVETYTDMIIGLPGETYDSFADGVSNAIQNGQHNRIKMNDLSILPNAEMGDPEYQKKFGMEMVESRTLSVHGSRAEAEEEIPENQILVIATDSMPQPDWVRTRVYAWTVALLHFDKTLQIPSVLLNEVCSLTYREIAEAVTEGDLSDYPVLQGVRSFFVEHATNIQHGGPEFAMSEDWLNIWWPPDEYALIKLCFENNLDRFYDETESRIHGLLAEKTLSIPRDLLHDAFQLNRALLKQPNITEDLVLETSHNVLEFYESVLTGQSVPLEKTPSKYHIDRSSKTWASWDDWCREVIWFGNKTGAYLYGSAPAQAQLAGHF